MDGLDVFVNVVEVLLLLLIGWVVMDWLIGKRRRHTATHQGRIGRHD